jgi:hypothetical protein
MQPFLIGDVEVMGIHPERKCFNILVKLQLKSEQIPDPAMYGLCLRGGYYPPEVQEVLQNKVRCAVNYLMAEDFLPENLEEWITNIGVIIYRDNEK